MIDLHFWPTPNGYKITMFLEEAALAYRVVPVNIGRGEQFTPEFLAISPNNRMPAIVDHDPSDHGAPISVFESGAILLYLAEKVGRFLPTDVRAKTEAIEWLMWQMGGVGPMFGQVGHFLFYAPEKIAYGVDRYTKEVGRLCGVLDRRLEGRDFVAGEYSIADMALYPWVKLLESYQQKRADFPRVAAWVDRLGARPAVARAMEVGSEHKKPGPLDEEAKKILFGQPPR